MGRLLGERVHRTATIGLSIVDCDELEMSPGSRIGHFTVLQSTRSTHIGDYCLVSSNVCITPGASVPDRSVIAMGAVVVGQLDVAGALYGGVPGRVLRSAVDAGTYFRRMRGFVKADAGRQDDGPDRGEA